MGKRCKYCGEKIETYKDFTEHRDCFWKGKKKQIWEANNDTGAFFGFSED